MAVYTHLSDNEIKQNVQQNYGVDVRKVNPVAEGIENSIYKLCGASGDVYAYVIFEDVQASLVEHYCTIFDQVARRLARLESVAEQHVAIPAGLPLTQAQDGRRFTSMIHDATTQDAKPCVLQPWLDGGVVQPNVQLCQQLGQFLGVVNSLSPSTPCFEPGSMTTYQGLPVNQHLWRINKFEAQVSNMSIATQQQFHAYQAQVQPVIAAHKNLTYGLTHGDLFADNALAAGHRLTGVIDFFNASWSPLLLDLAICLMDWCYAAGEFQRDNIEALVQGFSEKCDGIPSFDIEYWPELVQLAAFRFWCTRQEYYAACQHRGVQPVDNRDPAFCAQVFAQVSGQESFLRRVMASI